MKKLVALISIFIPFYSFADFSCTVSVERVLVYGNGSVNIKHSGHDDFTYICNTKGTWKGIDTVTCSLWVGMLQSTQNNDKKAIFYYPGSGTCATLPIYGNAPAPTYIGAIK
ncbi:hypothetical protein [Vibrio sagamiensis]|uniref:Uncharacterized protein n=1 Tax=Vibrio sagamiensis NBRC 104589 TaxID=1219064 RepID=A0A511QK43_9VIBR|nr:hypothetical protein [Vibrio sagamiensis]GEM77693.1 hypothetical protein VSA01S_38050 [Vibrio sagamiensis NBRC 104589]